MSGLLRAMAKLREGTEILRTGGGIHLTAGDCNALLDKLDAQDDLLRRLSEWDMLGVKPDGTGVTADGPYWQREIARVRSRGN